MTANSSLLITSINKSINDIQIILFSQDNSLSYDQEVPLSDHMASIHL
jgi:hypothetical protein